MFSLEGRKVLITGATGGIGFEIAMKFADAGAKIFVTGMEESRIMKLKGSLGDAFAGYCIADLTNSDSIKNLFDTAVKEMGDIDILVNSAGVTRDQLFLQVKKEDWDFQMKINLESVWNLTQLVLRKMIKQNYGRIITLSSVVGCMGNSGQSVYSIAKAALLGMTKTLARESAKKNVTVNAIAPGFIETAMTKDLLDKNPEILNNIPVGRAGTPEEVAAGALYLASEEAGYVTGTTLHINGGMLMC
ncbi:MAG: 3-oxoacyl-ACP reductase FabG [Alphaproteobacteria bacterium]|nr:MAG: 3-oxoacyl-ACP reductase FabG [Alphaproteobacteria bacterium]